MNFLKKFETLSGYEAYAESDAFVEPNVSLVESEAVKYNADRPIPVPHDYSQDYLTFNILAGGTFNLTVSSEIPSFEPLTIYYSKDSGETWEEAYFSEYSYSIEAEDGDKILFKGDNPSYGYIHEQFGNINYLGCSFGGYSYGYRSPVFTVEGNIMSLVDSTGFRTNTTLTSAATFTSLFAGCVNLESAENLVLPATTLTDGCYGHMFAGCTSLTTAPVLPATTLANGCYENMFYNCTSLTTAPVLPVTTLANYCYSYMFQYCTSLTTAPELPATTLVTSCYENMFNDCTSLNYIKCLATTGFDSPNCTHKWVGTSSSDPYSYGVASEGTFVKDANADWSQTEWGSLYSPCSVPGDWTIVDA